MYQMPHEESVEKSTGQRVYLLGEYSAIHVSHENVASVLMMMVLMMMAMVMAMVVMMMMMTKLRLCRRL